MGTAARRGFAVLRETETTTGHEGVLGHGNCITIHRALKKNCDADSSSYATTMPHELNHHLTFRERSTIENTVETHPTTVCPLRASSFLRSCQNPRAPPRRPPLPPPPLVRNIFRRWTRIV